MFNAFDRKNRIDFAYDVTNGSDGQLVTTRKDGESLFPRLPSLGITWDFWLTLSPGAYTATVRGAGPNEAGEVLVEVYFVE